MNSDEEGHVERAATRSVAHHVPAWVFELIAGRLYCGPVPRKKLDAHYLTQTLHATHMVDLRGAPTDPSRFDYTSHWAEFAEPPEVVRTFKMPDNLSAIKDPMPLFVGCARDVVLPLLRDDHVVYVHYNEGYEEEATVALLAWFMYDKGSFPSSGDGDALSLWLAEVHYERLLDDPLKRAALVKTIHDMSASSNKSSGSMNRFVTKRPRK